MYSSTMALTYCESKRTSWTELGSILLTRAWGEEVTSCLALDLVSIGWIDGAGTALYLDKGELMAGDWVGKCCNVDEREGVVAWELVVIDEEPAWWETKGDYATWGHMEEIGEVTIGWRKSVEYPKDDDTALGVEEEMGIRVRKGNSLVLNFTFRDTYTLPDGCKHL